MHLMERAWVMKTGKPPRPIAEYSTIHLQALLLYSDEADDELNDIAQAEVDWMDRQVAAHSRTRRKKGHRVGPPGKRLPTPTSYDEPIYTGDPVADAWEDAIARGEVPDLDAPGDGSHLA